jgi:hypothetical protein
VSTTRNPKWHPVDQAAASALTMATNSPGLVYPVGTNGLPQQLQAMPGVCSYFVSGYTTGLPLPSGITVGGEMLVARADGALTKNYQFAFGTSSNGQVCYCGPFKGHGHHVSSGQAMPVNSMFNQTPFSTKK